MSRYRNSPAVLRVGINVVSSAMPFQVTPFRSQVFNEVSPLQDISISSSVELNFFTGTCIVSRIIRS